MLLYGLNFMRVIRKLEDPASLKVALSALEDKARCECCVVTYTKFSRCGDRIKIIACRYRLVNEIS